MGGERFLKGPKTPFWGCGGCGEASNWACRMACRECGKAAPARVQQAAVAASQKVQGPKAAQTRAPAGAWKAGPPRDELQLLRKEIAALKEHVVKQKEGQGGKQIPASPSAEECEQPDEVADKRQQLQKELDALRTVLGEDHVEVLSRKSALKELNKQKPLGSQLLAGQWRMGKLEKKLEAKSKAVGELEEQIASSQESLIAMKGEMEAVQEELEELKKEQAQVLEGQPKAAAQQAQPSLQSVRELLGKLAAADQSNQELLKSCEVVCQACEKEAQKVAGGEAPAGFPPSEPGGSGVQGAQAASQEGLDLELGDLDELMDQQEESMGVAWKAMDTAARKRLTKSLSDLASNKKRAIKPHEKKERG